jgi:hypothetical protein
VAVIQLLLGKGAMGMSKALSVDLRERVVAAIAAGAFAEQARTARRVA